MNAQGWSLRQQPSTEQGKAAMDALVQEARQLCTRSDLQPLFSKTACLPEDTTLEQMADKSRIRPDGATHARAMRMRHFRFANTFNDRRSVASLASLPSTGVRLSGWALSLRL
jgi:hypothetical protein